MHKGGSVRLEQGANIVQKSSDMKEAVVDSNNSFVCVYLCINSLGKLSFLLQKFNHFFVVFIVVRWVLIDGRRMPST